MCLLTENILSQKTPVESLLEVNMLQRLQQPGAGSSMETGARMGNDLSMIVFSILVPWSLCPCPPHCRPMVFRPTSLPWPYSLRHGGALRPHGSLHAARFSACRRKGNCLVTLRPRYQCVSYSIRNIGCTTHKCCICLAFTRTDVHLHDAK